MPRRVPVATNGGDNVYAAGRRDKGGVTFLKVLLWLILIGGVMFVVLVVPVFLFLLAPSMDTSMDNPVPVSGVPAPLRNTSQLVLSKSRGGVNWNDKDASGYTQLMKTARAGHHEVVLNLLLLGASHSIADGQGRTALHLAAEQGHAEVVDAFLSVEDVTCRSPEDFPRYAQQLPDAEPDLFKLFRYVKRDLRQEIARDQEGCTPFMLAIREGHNDCARKLFELNPKVRSVQDNAGRTPFMVAVSNNNLALIREQLGKQKEILRQSNSGMRPTLMFDTATIAVKDNEGTLPLELARAREYSELVTEVEGFLDFVIQLSLTRLERSDFPSIHHQRLADAYAAKGMEAESRASQEAADKAHRERS